MINEGKELYGSLEVILDTCNNKKRISLEAIECCFQAASDAWNLLKTRLAGYCFPSPEEEIFFFKNIKPLFTSAIEYFGLLAHAQLFKDSIHDPEDLIKFWHRELLRLNKFTNEHPVFYQYYKTGSTVNDLNWFTRAENDGSNFTKAKSHDLDREAATRYDYLISTLLALERYMLYAQKEYDASGGRTDFG